MNPKEYNTKKENFRNHLIATSNKWSETKRSFSKTMSQPKIKSLDMPNNNNAENFYRKTALLWEKVFSIVPANPSDRVISDFLEQSSTKGNIYKLIDKKIKETYKSEENSVYIISARRGAGKSTSQNLWLSINAHTYEKEHNRVLIRWNAHRVQHMYRDLLIMEKNIKHFTVHDYISFQLVYIVIKNGSNNSDYKDTILHKLYNYLIKLNEPVNDHGLSDRSINTIPDFLNYFKVEIDKNSTEDLKAPPNNARDNRWMNPLFKLITDASTVHGSKKWKTVNTVKNIADRIYQYLKKQDCQLIVFMDGIDNMSWFSKMPGTKARTEPNSKSLRTSYKMVISDIRKYMDNPSSGTGLITHALLFCRPDTVEHLMRDNSAPLRNRFKFYPYFDNVNETFSFSEIINKKIKLLKLGHDYFSGKKTAISNAYSKMYAENTSDDNDDNDDNVILDSIDMGTFRAYRDSYLCYINIEWHNHIKILLSHIVTLKGLSNLAEKQFTIEHIGFENFRALTFNSIEIANKLVKSYPDILSSLLKNTDEYAKTELVDFHTQGKKLRIKKFITQDTQLARLIRGGLVAFSSDATIRTNYEDIYGALIPSLFKYDVSILNRSPCPRVTRHRWGGLINLRILQLLNDVGSEGITEDEIISKISCLFEWPNNLVADNFTTLLEYGLIEPTENSQRQMMDDLDDNHLQFVSTVKAEIAIRLAFGYPDMAALMAIETPMCEQLDNIAVQDGSGRYRGFLKTMIIFYVALIKHIFIQKSIEEKNLPSNVRYFLEKITNNDAQHQAPSTEDITDECKVYELPISTIIQNYAIDAIMGALGKLKRTGHSQVYNSVLDKLTEMGLDINELMEA